MYRKFEIAKRMGFIKVQRWKFTLRVKTSDTQLIFHQDKLTLGINSFTFRSFKLIMLFSTINTYNSPYIKGYKKHFKYVSIL